MISHQYKCIFIHIPKCAGSSIERALGHADDLELKAQPDHRSVRMLETPIPFPQAVGSFDNLFQLGLRLRHSVRPQRNPNNTLSVSGEQYKSYFKFTIVRNPWARAFSWYKNCIRDANHKMRYGINEQTSLCEFLQKNIGRGSLRTQMSWITDFGGGIPMDYIGRFESLRSDFREVCSELQLPEVILPHELRGSGEDFRDHFDDHCIRLVKDAYKAEIDMFGFTFDA